MGAIDKKFPWQKKVVPQLIALEPRMLFDGAAAIVAVEAAQTANPADKDLNNPTTNTAPVQDARAEQTAGTPEVQALDSSRPIDPATSAQQLKLSLHNQSSLTELLANIDSVSAETNSRLLQISDADNRSDSLLAGRLLAEKLVVDFLSNSDIQQKMFSIFNGGQMGEPDAQWRAALDHLIQQIADNDYALQVELRTNTEMRGAMGAFAAQGDEGTPIIYLNADWLAMAPDHQSIARVLVEEIGHSFDARLNGSQDTQGDEGEVFATLLMGELTTQLDQSHADDHGTIVIDGVEVAIEEAAVSFKAIYQGTPSAWSLQASSITLTRMLDAVDGEIKFISADPAATYFAGNNVAGSLVYTDNANNVHTMDGVISRQFKTGSSTNAFYFYATGANGVVDGATRVDDTAYLLQVLNDSTTYTTGALVRTSSDPVDSALNAVKDSTVPVLTAATSYASGAQTALEDGVTAGRNATGNVLDASLTSGLTSPNVISAGGSDPASQTVVSSGTTASNGTQVIGRYGTLSIGANGTYEYVVANSDTTVQALRQSTNTLTDTFSYTVRDSNGNIATTTLVVTIQGNNDAPVAASDYNTAKIGGAGVAGNLLANDTDVDQNGETLRIVGLTASADVASYTAGATRITYTTSSGIASANGDKVFYLAGDGKYYPLSTSATLLDSAHAITATVTNTGNGYLITLSADPANYTIINGTRLGFDNGWSTSFTPPSNLKFADVTSSASTAQITLSNISGNIAVGMTVTGTNIPSATTVTSISGNSITLSKTPTGTPGSMTFSATGGATITGTYGTLVINANGEGGYTYTPNAAGSGGTDVFTYKMQDLGGSTSTATLNLNVLAAATTLNTVADTPSVTVGTPSLSGNIITNDVSTGGAISVLTAATASEALGTSQTITSGGYQDITGSYGVLRLYDTGAYTYTFKTDAVTVSTLAALSSSATLTDSFQYLAQNTSAARSAALITLTIQGVNDAPTLRLNTEGNGATNIATSFTQGGTAEPLVMQVGTHLSDPDNTYYSKLIVALTQRNFVDGVAEILQINGATGSNTSIANLGALTSGTTGSFTLGDINYTYIVDVAGGVASMTFTSNVAMSQPQTESLLTALHYNNTSSDPTASANRAFALSIFDNGNQNDTILGTGPLVSNTATSTITVYNTNTLPVATADIVSATEAGASAGVNPSGNVLTGDTTNATGTGIGDSGQGVTVTKAQAGLVLDVNASSVVALSSAANNGTSIDGTYGTLTIGADGTYQYVVNNSNTSVNALRVGQHLTDAFTYQISDTHSPARTSASTLTVTINGANDAPALVVTAVNDFIEDAVGNAIGSVVATYTTSDSDGDAITVTLSDTNNYVLGTGADAGKVLLTAAGLTRVNSGQDLPSFTLTPNDGSVDGLAASADPTVTQVLNAAPNLFVNSSQNNNNTTASAVIFTVEQYTGFSSNVLSTLQNYVANYTGANKYVATTSLIDFTDDPSGFSGDIPGSTPWPAATATSSVGTDGINDSFFARITTEFFVAQSDTYTFRTYNDDGVFLLIDGQLVISDTTYHPEAAYTGNILLSPGMHTLELYFYEGGGEASLELSVKSSTGPYQLVGSAGGLFTGAEDRSTASLTETDASLDASYTLSVSDADVADTVDLLVTNLVISGTGAGDLPVALTNSVLKDFLRISQGGTDNAATPGSVNNLTWSFDSDTEAFNWLNAGQTLILTYTVTATDSSLAAATDTQTVVITITGTNELPVVTAQTKTTAENTVLNSAVPVATDADADGQGFTYALVNDVPSGQGTLVFNTDGSYTFNPGTDFDDLAVGQGRSTSFSYRAIDARMGPSLPETVTINVTGTNDAPVLSAIAPSLTSVTENDTSNNGQTVSSFLSNSVTDVDSGAVEGIAITGLNAGNGTWQYSLNGSTWFNVGTVSTSTALLLRSNDYIRFVPDGINGTTASLTYKAWDQTSGAQGDKVDVQTVGGTTAFSTASDTATILVSSINDAPVVTAGGSASYTENGSGVIIDASITIADVDSANLTGATVTVSAGFTSGDVLEFINQSGISGSYNSGNGVLTLSGTATQTQYQQALRSVAYYSTNDNPTATSATRTVTWQVNDGEASNNLSNQPTSSISITAVNDAPNITAPDTSAQPLSVAEDLTLSFTGATLISVSDVEGTVTSVKVTVLHGSLNTTLETTGASLSAGAISSSTFTLTGTQNQINAALGFLTYTGDANYSGSDTLTIVATDNNAASRTSTVAISVTPVNDAPSVDFLSRAGTLIFTADNAARVYLNGQFVGYTNDWTQPYTFSGLNVLPGKNVLAVLAYDVGGVAAMSARFETPSGTIGTSSSGWRVFNADPDTEGDYSSVSRDESRWVLPPDWAGVNYVEATYAGRSWEDPYRVSDYTYPWGNKTGDPVWLWTTNPNNVDVVLFRYEFNNTDAGPSRTYHAVEGTTLSLLPTSGQAGSYMKIADTDNPTSAMTVTYSIPDTADSGSLSVNTGSSGVTVLGGATSKTLTLSGTITQINNFLSGAAGGSFGYLAAPGAQTPSQIDMTIVVDDLGQTGSGGALQATTTARIEINHLPLAQADTADIIESVVTTSITNVTGNVLTNDTDPDSQTLAVSGYQSGSTSAILSNGVGVQRNGSYGSITIASNGALTYTLNNANSSVQALNVNQTLTDVFSYTVSDGNGGYATQTLTVTILGANDSPVVSAVSAAANEDASAVTITLSATDVDGSIASYTINTLPGNGTLYRDAARTIAVLAGDTVSSNTLYFVPAANWNGSTSFSYSATDNAAATSTAATATITVSAVNDASVLTAGGVLAYTENAAPAAIDTTVTITDIDSTHLIGATVTISAGLTTGDTLGFTNQNGISGAYNSGTGVLTLSGTATIAQYQAALRAVTYSSSNDTPTTTAATRTITWRVNDGGSGSNLSNQPTSTVNITPVNDAPAITAGNQVGYIEGAATTFGTGGAVVFDGNDDYIAIPSNTAFPTGNDHYTIEAWIKPDRYGAQGIIGWGNWGSTLQTNAFRLTDNGLVNYWWDVDLTVSVPNLTDGNWHHVAATFDGTTRAMYVDGVLVGSDTPTGHNVPATVSNARIGSTNNGEYFDGSIGEIRVWDIARTASQIANNRAVVLDPASTGLVALYKLNQGSGSTATNDATAMSSTLNGSLTNGATWTSNGMGQTTSTLSPALVIRDVDDSQLTGATVSISSGLSAGDQLVFVNQNGITGSYNANTGVLTLTGMASIADYQTALRSVVFNSTSNTPGDIATRQITWQVTDANAGAPGAGLPSNDAYTGISVTNTNDDPVLAAITSGSVADTLNAHTLGASSNLYGVLSATDPDSATTLTYAITGGTSTSYTSSGSGSVVTYNLMKQAAYGTIYLASASGKYLYVPDAAKVDALASGSNTSDSFTFSVSDGTATDSQSVTINITGANDLPEVAGYTVELVSGSQNPVLRYALPANVVAGDTIVLSYLGQTQPAITISSRDIGWGYIDVQLLLNLQDSTGTSSLDSVPVKWIDWTSRSSSSSAVGTLTTETQTVTVTLSSTSSLYGTQTNGGANYFNPTAPYISTGVAAPTSSDIIQFGQSGDRTLTFSEEVQNLYFSFVSMNGNGYLFNRDFDILSQALTNETRGYWGAGQAIKQEVVINGVTYYALNAVSGEPHGVVRFKGSFSSLTWTNPTTEYWHGFTVGIKSTTEDLQLVTGTFYNSASTAIASSPTTLVVFDPGVVQSATLDTSVSSASVAETNTSVSAAGTISLSDIDTSNVLVATVRDVDATGDTGDLSKAQVLAMLGVSTTDTSLLQTSVLNWSFDSDGEAFNWLAAGETLKFAYVVEVSDQSGGVVRTPVEVTIVGTNDVPVLNVVSNATVTDTAVDDTYADITGTLTGSDRDTTDTLSFELTGSSATSSGSYLTAGFNVNKTSPYGTFYLNTTSGAYKFVVNDSAVEALKTTQTVAFNVNDTDGTADSASQTITITLGGVNDTPVLNVLSNATVTDTAVDDTYADITGTLTGSDRDTTDTLSFELAESVETVESGFNVEKSTAYGTFYLNTTSGAYKFIVNDSAVEALKTTQTVAFNVNDTDGTADSASQTITITLGGVNDIPVLVNALQAQAINEDTPFSFQVPANSFTDIETPNTLTYTATLADGSTLPAWLYFDASTRTFSGTPDTNDVGLISVRVTATDPDHGATSGLFDLRIWRVVEIAGVTAPTIVEGHDLVFTVAFDYTSQITQQFSFNYTGGSATAGVDFVRYQPTFTAIGSGSVSYDANTGLVTVGPNVSGVQVVFRTLDDLLVEAVETVSINFGGTVCTGGISDGADMALFLSNVTVNEGSPHAVFRLNGVEGQRVQLALESYTLQTTPTGTTAATLGVDTGLQLQIFDGFGWQNYVPGHYVTYPSGSTALLVRVALVNDSQLEGPEAFKLIATGSLVGGGQSTVTATGVAIVGDTGTGAIYTSNGAENPNAPRDDDRTGVAYIPPVDPTDEQDLDGIPAFVEEILATLSSSAGFGGNIGDLNSDGIPDAEQPAVANLAWIQAQYFQSALAGELNEVRPIVTVEAVSPVVGQQGDLYTQLQGIEVPAQDDARFGGILPTSAAPLGYSIDAPWDPIIFCLSPIQGEIALIDADATRPGIQVVITIDISRAGIREGEFNGYLKYVSQAVLDAASTPITDLDGRVISAPGWYDFMQRQDATGAYVGDGARYVVSNGMITSIRLTLTDNAFGDNDPALNRITDPGLPVYMASNAAFVPPAIPKMITVNPLLDDDEEAELLLEEQQMPVVEAKGEWASKAHFTKASLNHTAIKHIEPEHTASPKPPATDGSWSRGTGDTALQNTLLPPDARTSQDGSIAYQLPQATFSGGTGPIHLMVVQRDGKALPNWVSFDTATGKMIGKVPTTLLQPLEIKVQARDSKGDKAETVFKIMPRQDKLGFVGKPSLTAQIHNAIQLRG